MTTLLDAARSSLVLEAAENYAIADPPQYVDEAGGAPNGPTTEHQTEEFERRFWQSVFADPERYWHTKFELYDCVLSEWVPRVPGLFWRPESEQLRKVSPEVIEQKTGTWVTFRPVGKSQKVMGGVGTLRFPTDAQGHRLVTVSSNLNASAGVTALLNDDVCQKLHYVIEGKQLARFAGTWIPMGGEWAHRFASTRGIPRGYLLVSDPGDITTTNDDVAPVRFHPFTIMEYESGNAKLFDFVYATVDSGDAAWRQNIEAFFDSYKNTNDRYGRYLTAADMVTPLWDAAYGSPSDLRRANGDSESQLSLLQARVRETISGTDTIEKTIAALGQVCVEKKDLRRYSDEINIPRSQWSSGGSLANATSQFIAKVVQREGKLEELIHRLTIDNPDLFTG